MTTNAPRLVPFSLEAEQAVLGSLLLDNLTLYPIQSEVSDADFYRADHQIIFRAACAMVKGGKPCDFVTLSENLKTRGELNDVGGLAYLSTLVDQSFSTSNVQEYARVIRDHSQCRKLIALGSELSEIAYKADAEAALAFLTSGANQVLTRVKNASVRFQEAVAGAQEVMAEARKQASVTGVGGAPIGLPSLDRLIGGFSGPRLYILAARPKCGKSAILNQFAINAAMNGWPGLIVSRELGKDELAIRAMSLISGLNVTKLHRGFKAESDEAFDKTVAIGDIPLWFDDFTGSLDQICAQIAAHKFRHGIQWAAVDHIGLVRTEQRFNTRNDQLGHISWTLKETAKRLKIPIIALSQLNRGSEKEARRPGVHDLRDSGNIEQDADAVIMMHVDPADRDKGIRPVQIGVPANRIGPSMWLDVPFMFDGQTQTFRESA